MKDIDKALSCNIPPSIHTSDILKHSLSLERQSMKHPSISIPDENLKLLPADSMEQQAFYEALFSPSQRSRSLIYLNKNLEMHEGEEQVSEEDSDDIYNRRKKKVQKLQEKKMNETKILEELKQSNNAKYKAIMSFLSLFYRLKKELTTIRIDYYSSKTFTALNNCDADTLMHLAKVLSTMIENLYGLSAHNKEIENIEIKSQFMIIPRFLVSTAKIKKLINDENLQESITFLIYHRCFGHYNNEANKKFPEEQQMSYFRTLIKQKNGREKFKKICSINHGSKFSNKNKNQYYRLYSQSLKFLSAVECEMKKGKKYEKIKKQLVDLSQDSDSESEESQAQQKEFVYHKAESLQSIQHFLEKQPNVNGDKPLSFQSTRSGSIQTMRHEKKKKIKKSTTMPLGEITQKSEKMKLKTRRAFTMRQDKKYHPHLLISPPANEEQGQP